MNEKIGDKYPTDEELHNAVKTNDIQSFGSKLNTAYIVQLRFTDSLWNILHLVVYYQNKEFTELVLDLESSKKLIQGKDKNGETPLHLSCFKTDADITLLLLGRGASFYTRNIYQKDPIDVIQNYVERKAFLKFLLSNKSKLNKKETDFLVEHQNKCDYIESLAEVIYASDNVHQFKIERGLVIKPDFDIVRMQSRTRKENMRLLKGFKMGFRVKENFYLEEDKKTYDPVGSKMKLRDDIMNKPSVFLDPISSHVDMNNYISPMPYQFNEVPHSVQDSDRELMSEIVTPDVGSRLFKKIDANQSKQSEYLSKKYSPEKPSIVITPIAQIDEEEDEYPPEPSVFGKSGKKSIGSSLKKMKRRKPKFQENNDENENMFNSNNYDDIKLSTITDNYKTINQSLSKNKFVPLKTSQNFGFESKLKKSRENSELKKSVIIAQKNNEVYNEKLGFTKIKQSLDDMEGYFQNRRDIFAQGSNVKTKKLKKDDSSRSVKSKFLKEKLATHKEKRKLSKSGFKDKNDGRESTVLLGRGKPKESSKNRVNDIEEDDPYKTFHFKETKKRVKIKDNEDLPPESFFGKLDKFKIVEKKEEKTKKPKKKNRKGGAKLVIYDS